MKILLSTIIVSTLFTGSAFASNTAGIEQTTTVLMQQQNKIVTQAIESEVKQDIYFAIRAMKMPKILMNKMVIAQAKRPQLKTQDSE